ncbi:unnamed protein product [Ophioblennius macclurei]
MRSLSLLLLVAVAASAKSYNSTRRVQRDVLVRSKRRWVLSTIDLVEEKEADYPIEISRMFNDKTPGKNFKFKISGDGVNEGIFTIDESTGIVLAHKPVDREQKDTYHIKFEVLEKETGEPIDKELSFDVEIGDINDNPPRFQVERFNVAVRENATEGYLPVQLYVSDIDEPDTPNSRFTISVLSQTGSSELGDPKFEVDQLDTRMAQLAFTGCFDYDKQKQYQVVIVAKDQGKPQLSSTAVATLRIEESNSHLPTFKQKKYEGEAHEMVAKNDVLRVSVEDKDTRNTDGWRALYFFISGNDDGTYKIETDPTTNDGILSIVKGKNYDVTTLETLEIGVKNAEDLFLCKDGKVVSKKQHPKPDTATIVLKMIDSNDAPTFGRETSHVYVTEEEQPGQDLFTPVVHDEDSTNIRYELIEDPAGWMAIDKATGKLTTIKKMDRESPFVDEHNVYSVIIGAIDDGEPPGTATCTVQIHLRDINDNDPQLVDNTTVLCGNRDNKVMVPAQDPDQAPYTGPFTFTIAGDESLKEYWKLSPSFGMEGGLISLKELAYGNYSIPLNIQDQQNQVGKRTLKVVLCDCGDKNVCREREPAATSLGPAAIGLIFAGLLLFALLLLIFMCDTGENKFQPMDEGNQTLITYNQEGGGAACKAEPTLIRTPTSDVNVMEEIKQSTIRTTEAGQGMTEIDGYNSKFTTLDSNMQTMGAYNQRDTYRSQNSQNMHGMYSTWGNTRTSRKNYYQNSSSQYGRSLSMQSNQHVADQIERRLYVIEGGHGEESVDQFSKYAYEGQGSKCQSLDELSLVNLDEDLQFLDDLGLKFKTLGKICRETVEEKKVQV